MYAEPVSPFARHGCEKMIYDVRMGPQALYHDGLIYLVYQANPDGPEAHPHVCAYDPAARSWSAAVQVGMVSHYDHHFAPVLWIDGDEYLHILYHCHGRDGGRHLVSAKPRSIQEWVPGPEIWKSISYPRVLSLPDGRLLLYHRTFGHMGYWSYQLSRDGGYTWSRPHPLIDFDRDPQQGSDTWAGSYQSVCLGADGTTLHVGFVYWDERKATNPLYGMRMAAANRYHLYYACLDLDSGRLAAIDGDPLEPPVSREQAERCKVWDTGHRLTNMPSILNDASGRPCFLLPVSDDSPWNGQFHFVRHHRGEWSRTAVTRANNTWDGCLLSRDASGELVAYLVSGEHDGRMLSYGGGTLQEWRSADEGVSWAWQRDLVPEPGLIYNNPKAVDRSTGGTLDDALIFYGWEGPGGIQVQTGSLISGVAPRVQLPEDAPAGNRGQAYLWHGGEWL